MPTELSPGMKRAADELFDRHIEPELKKVSAGVFDAAVRGCVLICLGIQHELTRSREAYAPWEVAERIAKALDEYREAGID